MNQEIKSVVLSLGKEIKKDLPFFGICGFLVGWLMIVQFRLKETGVAPKDSWADALFSDFVSFNAFGLVFVGLLGIASFVTCINACGCRFPKLESMVAHLEVRLTQLASSIISFTIGLSCCSVAHAFFTVSAKGGLLALLIVLFDGLIVSGFVSASLTARRSPPFDKWFVTLGMLGIALVLVACFVFYGTKPEKVAHFPAERDNPQVEAYINSHKLQTWNSVVFGSIVNGL